MGLMTVAFRENRPELEGHAAIGHVRYSTTGSSHHSNIQPIFAYSRDGFVGLGHNGNLTNTSELKAQMAEAGVKFQTTTDSEVILNLIALSEEPDLIARIEESLLKLKGAFSLVIMTPDKLIGVRDPLGYRPLCLGKLSDGGLALASESCALDAVKAELIRELEPGEMVVIGKNGWESRVYSSQDIHRGCVFEYIYFARPDSVMNKKSVWETRFRLGRQLAREFGHSADLVMPVPDTGITAALGFSHESGLPFTEGLIKNRYVGRSFIMPEQMSREATVEMKLNPIRANLLDKKVVLIDDSIVRGTTSRKIISLLRGAGAREVHLCVSSPPITHPCYYGIDTSIRKELIAAVKSVEEIREYLNLDSLLYLSRQGLLDSMEDSRQLENCMECFTQGLQLA
jgi:amidophosphoribosyltransferase